MQAYPNPTFSIVENARWLGPLEIASRRPLLALAIAVFLLVGLFQFLEDEKRPLILNVVMVAAYLIPSIMYCYLLRFAHHDVELLRTFDPNLPDLTRLTVPKKEAIGELFTALIVSFFLCSTFGGLLFTESFGEYLQSWTAQRGEVHFLYGMLFYMNITTVLVLFFVFRLVRHLIHYAANIRISLFRYRVYSTFSGVFVIYFSGTVILLSVALLLGPFFGFDGVLVASIFFFGALPWSLLVGLPIFKIAKRMSKARESELLRVEELIDKTTSAGVDAGDDYLNRLLEYERQVMDVWVWPFSSKIKQLLLFGLLPPLTWLIGAMIEVVIEASL